MPISSPEPVASTSRATTAAQSVEAEAHDINIASVTNSQTRCESINTQLNPKALPVTDGLLKAWGEQKQKQAGAEPSASPKKQTTKKQTASAQKKHQKNRRGRSSQQQANLKALDGLFHNEKPASYDAFLEKISRVPISKIKKEPKAAEEVTPLISPQQAIEAAASLLSSGLNTNASYWALSENLNLHPHANPNADSFIDRLYAFANASTQYQGAKTPQQKGKQTSAEKASLSQGVTPMPLKTEQASHKSNPETVNTTTSNSATIASATSLFSMGVIAQAKNWPMRILGLMGLVASQAENSQAAPITPNIVENNTNSNGTDFDDLTRNSSSANASAPNPTPQSHSPAPSNTSNNTQSIPTEVKNHLSALNLQVEDLAILGKFEIKKLPPAQKNAIITIALAELLYQMQFGQLAEQEPATRHRRNPEPSLTHVAEHFVQAEGWKDPAHLKAFVSQINKRKKRGAEEDLSLTEKADLTRRLLFESASMPSDELAQHLNIHGTVSPETKALLHRHFPDSRHSETGKIAKVVEKCTLGRFLTDVNPILGIEGAIEQLGRSIEELIKSRDWTEEQKIAFRIRTLEGYKSRYKQFSRAERFWQDVREGYAYGVPAVIMFENLRQDMLAKRDMTEMTVEEIERIKVAKNGWQSALGLMPGVAAVNGLLDLGEAIHKGSKDICRYLEDIFIAGLGAAELAGGLIGAHQFEEHIPNPISEVSQDILNQKLARVEADLESQLAENVHEQITQAEQEFKQQTPVITINEHQYVYLNGGENTGLYKIEPHSDGVKLVSLTQPEKILSQYTLNEGEEFVSHKLKEQIVSANEAQIWQDLTTQSHNYEIIKTRYSHHLNHIEHLTHEQMRLGNKYGELETRLKAEKGGKEQTNLNARLTHISTHLKTIAEKLEQAEAHRLALEEQLTKSQMHWLLLKAEAADLIPSLNLAEITKSYEELVKASLEHPESAADALTKLEDLLKEQTSSKNDQVDLRLKDIIQEAKTKADEHLQAALDNAHAGDKKYSQIHVDDNGTDFYVMRKGKGENEYKYKLVKEPHSQMYTLEAQSPKAPKEHGRFTMRQDGYLERAGLKGGMNNGEEVNPNPAGGAGHSNKVDPRQSLGINTHVDDMVKMSTKKVTKAKELQHIERTRSGWQVKPKRRPLMGLAVRKVETLFEEIIPERKEYSAVVHGSKSGMYVLKEYEGKVYRFKLVKEQHAELYKLRFDGEAGQYLETHPPIPTLKDHRLYRINGANELEQVGLKGGGKTTQHLTQAQKEIIRTNPLYQSALKALNERFRVEGLTFRLSELQQELLLVSRNIEELRPAQKEPSLLNPAQQRALLELERQKEAVLVSIQQTDEQMKTLLPQGEEGKTNAETALESKIAEIERALAHDRREAHILYKSLRQKRNSVNSELHKKAAEQAVLMQEIEDLKAEKPTEEAQKAANNKTLKNLMRKNKQIESKLNELTEKSKAASKAYNSAINNYDPHGLKQQMLEAKTLAESDFRAENKANNPPENPLESQPFKKRKRPENSNQDSAKKQTPLDMPYHEDGEQPGPSGVRQAQLYPEAIQEHQVIQDVEPAAIEPQAPQAEPIPQAPAPARQAPRVEQAPKVNPAQSVAKPAPVQAAPPKGAPSRARAKAPLQFGVRELPATEQQMRISSYFAKYKTFLDLSSKPINTARLQVLAELTKKIDLQLAITSTSIEKINKLPELQRTAQRENLIRLQATKETLVAQKAEATRQIQPIKSLIDAKTAAEKAVDLERKRLEQDAQKEIIRDYVTQQEKEAELKAEIQDLNKNYAELYQEIRQDNPRNPDPDLLERRTGLETLIREKTQELERLKAEIARFNPASSTERATALIARIEELVKSTN